MQCLSIISIGTINFIKIYAVFAALKKRENPSLNTATYFNDIASSWGLKKFNWISVVIMVHYYTSILMKITQPPKGKFEGLIESQK